MWPTSSLADGAIRQVVAPALPVRDGCGEEPVSFIDRPGFCRAGLADGVPGGAGHVHPVTVTGRRQYDDVQVDDATVDLLVGQRPARMSSSISGGRLVGTTIAATSSVTCSRPHRPRSHYSPSRVTTSLPWPLPRVPASQ